MRMTSVNSRGEDMDMANGVVHDTTPQELLVSTSTGSKTGSVSSSSSAVTTPSSCVVDDVVKMGHLKKFKGKKKWFVVRRESETGPARLEYFAKERYFRAGHQPRRTICLKACFNINRTESKVKWAIALHTHNDCLRIVFSSEEEMKEWLQLLNSLAGTEEEPTEDMPSKPHFEHVWLVQALNKGLGSKEGILGPYRLCLTSRELTLLKVGEGDERNTLLKFPLNVIRSVSHDSTFGCFFHIEFGRSAVTGPGQLSLRTEDNNIAQNMHLLILKAMQNYSKEEISHREGPRRGRTYTWNSGYSDSASSRPPSFASQTPPVMARMHSVDSGIPRTRTESINSTDSRSGHSPPISISQTPPTISFYSPMCSTTDSASSSYSYEHNNNRESRPTIQDGDSYVPWNPSEEALSLPLQPLDTADYVTTGGQAATSSSYMEMQSPMSPYNTYNNYVPMGVSPGSTLGAGHYGGCGNGSGKLSVSHSRNSSLIEDIEGYVPMIPGENPTTTGMGSESNIEDSYLEMDLSNSSRRKMNHSNDDRSLPASSIESLQSRTPSSDFPLEKVSSYFLPSDENEDSASRPVRCFSVGSRSDTGTTLKGRYGKNRLEAVQETFRIRALSVGAKNPRTGKPFTQFAPPPLTPNQNNSPNSSTSSVCLSSSWSGSGSTTGRWAHFSKSQISPASSQIPHDSDLMELDFSHNKEKKQVSGRRKSLSGIREQSTSASSSKASPSPSQSKGTLSESPDPYMSMDMGEPSTSSYASSAPIAIQKATDNLRSDGGVPLVSRLTGLDLNPLQNNCNPKDEEYMPMDFAPVVAKTLDKVPPATFTLNSSAQDAPSPSLLTSTSQMLSSIKESPEKQEFGLGKFQRRTVQSTIEEESVPGFTYADLDHPRTGGAHPLATSSVPSPASRLSYPAAVNYSQINFKKSPSTS